MGALAMKSVALAARRFPAFNGFLPRREIRAVVRRFMSAWRSPFAAVDWLRPQSMMRTGFRSTSSWLACATSFQRMRAGRIRSSEIADATITVSSLGERGVEALYGIIYPPQVAIVGFGKVVARPWVDRWSHRAAFGRDHHACGRPPGERWPCAARCSWPRSASCCRSRTSYERARHSRGAARGTRQHRARNGFETVDPSADLREALDINSMDFLNFVIAIHHRLGVDIPEIDYPKLMTLDGAVSYLKPKLGAVKG